MCRSPLFCRQADAVGGHPTQTIICAVYPRSHRAPAPICARERSGRRTPMKLPRRTISASGRRRRRPAGRIPHREGASLSVAAGAHRRPICRRRIDRHHRSSDRPMAVGASRPAICHREQAGSRQQYWYGGGRECAAGRIHTPPGRRIVRDQCDALRETQFQLPPRHHTRRRRHLDPLHYGG